MSTTSKLGADMLTDEQLIEIASRYAHSDGWLNGDGALNFARALLARQPAAIDKQEADSGECVSCVDGKCVTGKNCVTLGRDSYQCGYCKDTGYLPDGNHCQWCAAPLDNEASKPAPSVEQDERGACELCNGVGKIGIPGQRCFACDGCGKSFEARAASTSANVAQGAEAVVKKP